MGPSMYAGAEGIGVAAEEGGGLGVVATTKGSLLNTKYPF